MDRVDSVGLVAVNSGEDDGGCRLIFVCFAVVICGSGGRPAVCQQAIGTSGRVSGQLARDGVDDPIDVSTWTREERIAFLYPNAFFLILLAVIAIWTLEKIVNGKVIIDDLDALEEENRQRLAEAERVIRGDVDGMDGSRDDETDGARTQP